ncbi:OsmC family protein [Virgibacillus siamensis]|uniref:OsmC family protein n=1 Tax=Virgibacillus siamensis TaxID=480071 RepID=UPI0009875A09|nr:OsmC family protein [Virgibacillus siamensis]
MANVTFASEVTWSGNGVLSTADVQGKKFNIDEPRELGGTDQAPNPVEYLLGALGGCINVLVTSFAKQFSVEVKDLSVHIEGDLDPDGFQGKNPNVRPGYQEIRYRIDIDSPSPDENVKALIEHVEKVCPVKDTLQGTAVKNLNYISAT